MGPTRRWFICFLLFTGASSAFSQQPAQPAVTLDSAIATLAESLSENFPAETVVAVLSFTAPPEGGAAVSDYIMEELSMTLANLGRLKVVDRRNLELVRQELNLQISGDVSDESAQAIGHMLGAASIISGSLALAGDNYRMRIQAISVETAQIQYGNTVPVLLDRHLAGLLNIQLAGEIPWANKWLYFGVRGGASLGIFSLVEENYEDGYSWDGPQPCFEAGASLSLQITRSLAFQLEALYSQDTFAYEVELSDGWNRNYYEASFTTRSLMLPALLKLTVRSRLLLFALYGGAYLTLPIGAMAYETETGLSGSFQFSVPAGLSGGLAFGINLGPGALFLDIRYSADMGNTSVSDDFGTLQVYSRSKVMFSLGYEFGLFNKK